MQTVELRAGEPVVVGDVTIELVQTGTHCPGSEAKATAIIQIEENQE